MGIDDFRDVSDIMGSYHGLWNEFCSLNIRTIFEAFLMDKTLREKRCHNLPVVHNGEEALAMFPKLIGMKGPSEYDKIRAGMLAYCELDTRSMVEVLKVLRNAVK